ncbi:hypothetical protein VTO42DRAFT_3219 [Malbranchea cinnamomea]
MNCPSRTDESPLHPEWNQNPPFLPADLTTREDLNGIVNARQFRKKDECAAPDFTGLLGRAMELETEESSFPPSPPFASAKLRLCHRDEVCAAKPGLSNITHRYVSQMQGLYSFLCWCRNWLWPCTIIGIIPAFLYFFRYPPTYHHQGTTFSVVQEHVRRSSTCGSNRSMENYNMPLHVGALVIILFVSTTACAFPMLVIRFPRLHIPASFLFVVRHFGTGVLIATAFVHLLPTAFQSLGDPCLSDFWTNDYPAMPGAISLAAVFLVTLVEMMFSSGAHMCGNAEVIHQAVSSPVMRSSPAPRAADYDQDNHDDLENNIGRKSDRDSANRPPLLHRNSSRRGHDPLCGRTTSIGRELAQMNFDSARYDQARTSRDGYQKEMEACQSTEMTMDTVTEFLTPEQKRKKALLQCALLEMGILFHSIFIGMALSVSIGNEFVILLIAIAFHQLFEGLALGSRIAALSWEPKALQPWLMALAYGCTTPLGQAIGLGTHDLYSPDSDVGLIVVGVMNAISAGLLVYASLVELLSEDFLSDESWRHLRGKRRVIACILVFLGAVGMSLIGAWA